MGQTSTRSPSRRGMERHWKRETLMLHTGWYQSERNFSSSSKLKSKPRKFCTLPMPMDELYPRLLERGLISPVFLRLSPHHLHDSSKQCEFHFGILGHSLEDCHAMKRRVQDLVNHGILRINEGSTPSVIIAWSPEHHKVEVKDGTFIPSLKSQGPTTSDIQPVHLSTLPTHLEARSLQCPRFDQSSPRSPIIQMTHAVLIGRKLTTLRTNTWHSSGRYKSLVVWNLKYLLLSNLGSWICIPSTQRGSSWQLTPIVVSHQRIKMIEPSGNLFKGAPKPKTSSFPRKNFKTRQDITLLLFPALFVFSFKTIMVCCQNTIFTPKIFSCVGTQNEVARTKPVWPKRGLVALKNSKKHSRECISWGLGRFDQCWPSLTRVDRGWPSLTKVWPRPWSGQKQDLIDYPLTIK